MNRILMCVVAAGAVVTLGLTTPGDRAVTTEAEPGLITVEASVGQVVDDSAFADAMAPAPAAAAVSSTKSQPKRRSAAARSFELGDWGRFPKRVRIFALCVAHHESWGKHNGRRLWTAINLAGSSASGFAQWVDSTWRGQAARAKIGRGYSRAHHAPPRVQAAVFAHQVMHYGRYPWRGTNCPGTY